MILKDCGWVENDGTLVWLVWITRITNSTFSDQIVRNKQLHAQEIVERDTICPSTCQPQRKESIFLAKNSA